MYKARSLPRYAEFETPRGKVAGVIFADGGKIRGGNSAFTYVGDFQQTGHAVVCTVAARRHTDNPRHPSRFGFDQVRLTLPGFEKDGFAALDGPVAEAPSLGCKAVLKRQCD
jgi:hypothetical protein